MAYGRGMVNPYVYPDPLYDQYMNHVVQKLGNPDKNRRIDPEESTLDWCALMLGVPTFMRTMDFIGLSTYGYPMFDKRSWGVGCINIHVFHIEKYERFHLDIGCDYIQDIYEVFKNKSIRLPKDILNITWRNKR